MIVRGADSEHTMSIEDTIGYLGDAPACDVCGKSLEGCGAFARVNHHGRMIALCCPMCLEVFQKEPALYLARLDKIARYRTLRESVKNPPPGQP